MCEVVVESKASLPSSGGRASLSHLHPSKLNKQLQQQHEHTRHTRQVLRWPCSVKRNCESYLVSRLVSLSLKWLIACWIHKQLHASLTSVTEATEDYPRFQRVLSSERFYELVSQNEILQAQLEVQREVEPQIKELIQLAEEGLHGLQKRERSLHEMVSR